MIPMWSSEKHKLNQYYKTELDFLREKAEDFSRDHPSIAESLKLSNGRSSDPHIEMLLQSFAFLTGRLQYRLNAESPEVSNQLLANLYPHLTAPIPSMAIVEAQVIPDGANFSNGYVLKRGRLLTAEGVGDNLEKNTCTTKICYDTDLWPLNTVKINSDPTNRHEFLSTEAGFRNAFCHVKAVLNIQVENTGNDPISDLNLQNLRFYINGDEQQTSALYELLTNNVIGLSVKNDSGEITHLENFSITPQGFSDDQAALPYTRSTHQGYRLLQEYFSFPGKFLFVDINGLEGISANKHFELLVLLTKPIDRRIYLDHSVLKLNCMPVINLFQKTTEPIRLDKQRSEYRLVPDIKQYHYCEIHSVEEVIAVDTNGQSKRIAPQFSMDAPGTESFQQGFWSINRQRSHVNSLPGTESYLSFFDANSNPNSPAEDSVYAKTLCCNRQLMEQMRIGAKFELDGGGPVKGLVLITKPSRHQTPPTQGAVPWKLISQLTLNQLSLSNNLQALSTLKQILILHAGEYSRLNQNQIDSITDIKLRQVVQHTGPDAWRGFSDGTEITITLDEDIFQGRSSYLFCEVLSRFFALYTSVNSFTQLALEFKKQNRGIVKRWQVLAGEQALV